MVRGVVIWCSRAEGKALIWCEDSGSLAIAAGPGCWRNPKLSVEVGDYVGFKAGVLGRERSCRDIHLIAHQVAPDLPESIRATPKPPGGGPRGNRLLHLCASRD